MPPCATPRRRPTACQILPLVLERNRNGSASPSHAVEDGMMTVKETLVFHVRLAQDGALLIWRRLEIRGEGTIGTFAARSRTPCRGRTHLHEFRFPTGDKETRIGIPGLDEFKHEEEILASWETSLRAGSWRPRPSSYVYDFGDHWVHIVTLESRRRAESGGRYPRAPPASDGAHLRMSAARADTWSLSRRFRTGDTASINRIPVDRWALGFRGLPAGEGGILEAGKSASAGGSSVSDSPPSQAAAPGVGARNRAAAVAGADLHGDLQARNEVGDGAGGALGGAPPCPPGLIMRKPQVAELVIGRRYTQPG